MSLHRVGIAMIDGYQTLDVTGPFELFNAANIARRHGGTSDVYEVLLVGDERHPAIAEAQAYITNNLASDLRVERVSAQVAMSPRHFARIFAQELDLTPAAFVQLARLEGAKDLLETTEHPLTSIAEQVGLGSTETLRRLMATNVGVSPEAYRSRFSRTRSSLE